jgi:high-affinity iron transporter
VPYWAGLWFGVFPTWETLIAQVAAFVFVIGSYFLAQEVKVKRPQRRLRDHPESEEAAREHEPASV